MHLLQPVAKHRPVVFVENVLTEMDPVGGIDSEDSNIISRVVNLAERKPVGKDWSASRVAVGQNVGGVKKLRVP